MLDESKFRWEPPREGDKYNVGSLGYQTIVIGTLGRQVVARIYERDQPPGTPWAERKPRYAAWLVHREGDGGSSSRFIRDLDILETLQELTEDHMFGAFRRWLVCSCCGHAHDPTLTRERDRLVDLGLCFDCDYWLAREMGPRKPNCFVAAGTWYSIAPPARPGTPAHCKGYGGTRWVVRFEDGRVVETDNLWNNGKVPDYLVGRFPDTAQLGSAEKGSR